MHNDWMNVQWFQSRKKKLGITDAQIGQAMAVDRSVANKVMNGKVAFDARKATQVARLFQVTPEEVLYQAGITKTEPIAIVSDHAPTRAIGGGETVEVISLDLSISMGPGTLIEDFVEEEPVRFDIGLLRAVTRSPFTNLRVVKGIGDSMEPTLRTFDRLLIDTSEKMLSRAHGIYWMDHLGAHGVKRLRPMGEGRVLIMSDNPHVPDYDVPAEELRIHGRAVWLMRDL
jgi:transcriptional regulator with XRE-family HTH domain